MDMDRIIDTLMGLDQAYQKRNQQKTLDCIIELHSEVSGSKDHGEVFSILSTVLVSYVAYAGRREPYALDQSIVFTAAEKILSQLTDERMQDYLRREMMGLARRG